MGDAVRAVVEVQGGEQVHGVVVDVLVRLVELPDYRLVVQTQQPRLFRRDAGDHRLLAVSAQVARERLLVRRDQLPDLGGRELAVEERIVRAVHLPF